MKLFETHCHLDFNDYKKDRTEVINKSLREGVEYFVNVGIDAHTSRESIKLAEKYPQFFAAAGFHPHEAKHYDENNLRDLLKHPRIVALGEIGLDYFRNRSPKDLQIQAFKSQIELAKELGLPLIVHNREADDDCWSLLAEYSPSNVVFHCYSGDLILAEKIWERGWFVSFTGTVTYPKNRMEDVIRNAPLDKIMIETDSPFLSPQHQRGKRNDPSTLRYVIEKVSEIRREPPLMIAEKVFENSFEFFLRKNLNK